MKKKRNTKIKKSGDSRNKNRDVLKKGRSHKKIKRYEREKRR